MPNTTSTHQKALALNLDSGKYGTVAEIGAGQEVSRWFFHVGGAAGTIAKTICAYDMEVSDALYGKGVRYVSRARVQAMLDREFDLLIQRLGASRGDKTTFFVFADSVSARNYAGTNECHGWLGLRFQTTPGGPAQDILLHVNMQDNANQLQQDALGILGINLIYGAFFHRDWNSFLLSMLDNIAPGRLEIDAVYCSGSELSAPSPVEVGVQLVQHGLCEAVMLAKTGDLVPPTEAFHNRPLLLSRTSLERSKPELLSVMLREGTERLNHERAEKTKEPISFLELNHSPPNDEPWSVGQVRQHLLDMLNIADHVLLTSYRENYLLTHYLRCYAPEQPIRFVIGASSLVLFFEHRYYSDVPGRILEGLGRLFAHNIKVYVKPMPRREFDSYLAAAGIQGANFRSSDAESVGIEDLHFEPSLEQLFQYLRSIDGLVSLT